MVKRSNCEGDTLAFSCRRVVGVRPWAGREAGQLVGVVLPIIPLSAQHNSKRYYYACQSNYLIASNRRLKVLPYPEFTDNLCQARVSDFS